MPDSARTSNQRLRILYLCKILLEKTDEEHSLASPEIIEQLASYGITAGRKAVYEDIEALKSFGLDIVGTIGRISGYRVVSRDFELSELKLLADAVSSSRFLTEKKSNALLKKIEGLSSIYDAKQIQRQVYVANRVKANNEQICINVDIVHRAISENKKISFKYFDYDTKLKKKYRNGKRSCSPYALAWNDEQYYLIAYNDNRKCISNFRLDRMEHIEILDEAVKEKPENFDVAKYLNSSFSMFSGKTQNVKLRFENGLVNPVIDRFGKNIRVIPDGDEHFTVRIQVKAEHPMPFFGWLFQFGTGAQIVEPTELRDAYRDNLGKILSLYQNS